jgi:hypothetical protein
MDRQNIAGTVMQGLTLVRFQKVIGRINRLPPAPFILMKTGLPRKT